ncbi:hypothetical protein ABW19_dt0203532 [Dactylella cylindrospora]|nr:hypothetical protein ABW19_dt0203532 [Dactylella cylindrospora]
MVEGGTRLSYLETHLRRGDHRMRLKGTSFYMRYSTSEKRNSPCHLVLGNHQDIFRQVYMSGLCLHRRVIRLLMMGQEFKNCDLLRYRANLSIAGNRSTSRGRH